MLKTPLAGPVAGDATQDGTCLLPGDMETRVLVDRNCRQDWVLLNHCCKGREYTVRD